MTVLSELSKLNEHPKCSECQLKLVATGNGIEYDDYLQQLFREVQQVLHCVRSSHQRCSVRKGIFRNFAKFTGKRLWQNLFLNKIAGLRSKACSFIRKETLVQMLSCEFCESSINTLFREHL